MGGRAARPPTCVKGRSLRWRELASCEGAAPGAEKGVGEGEELALAGPEGFLAEMGSGAQSLGRCRVVSGGWAHRWP